MCHAGDGRYERGSGAEGKGVEDGCPGESTMPTAGGRERAGMEGAERKRAGRGAAGLETPTGETTGQEMPAIKMAAKKATGQEAVVRETAGQEMSAMKTAAKKATALATTAKAASEQQTTTKEISTQATTVLETIAKKSIERKLLAQKPGAQGAAPQRTTTTNSTGSKSTATRPIAKAPAPDNFSPPPGSKLVGSAFETRAQEFLQRQRLHFIARNVSCRGGEIDLVMRDRDGSLVFVEVRARRQRQYGGAAASIGWVKKQRIVRAAQHYLATHSRVSRDQPVCRFDVIAFEAGRLVWLRDAFRADEV
ncbi:uncharacterized protein (TIGR00252 family) [Paraburkholderia sp. GAS333]